MFDGLVAKLLNKYLGKYIQNLDSQNLEVGILGGHVELTGLTLRPEALYELDLPIEVKAGYVGKISIEVDWFNVLSKPAQVTVEDVYALAGPVLDRTYDATREAALDNAKKKKILEDLEKSAAAEEAEEEDQGWLESLAATFVNNLQVTVERIHIRYEDKITNPEHPFACGVMLNKLAAETTDENWKPSQVDGEDTSVHKLVKLSGLSVYWNPYLPEQSLVRNKTGTSVWRNLLRNSIDAHRILDEEFDFILKPISAHAKVEMNKGAELTLPRLILDFFMDDIEVLVSRQQFLNMLCLQESFKVMAVNQRYRKYHPGVTFKGHAKEWWHYAYTAVVESKIRPFSWDKIKAHRRMYNLYKDLYKKKLYQPRDDDVAKQLVEMEKTLDVANVIIARGQAKYEYSKESPGSVEKKNSGGWWNFLFGPDSEDEEEDVISRPETTSDWILDTLSVEEREELFDAIGHGATGMSTQSNPEYVAHKFSLNLRLCSFSLVNYSKEVLKLSVTQFITELEHRPDSGGIKLCTNTESFTIEGMSVEHDLIPLITSDVASYAPSREKGKVFMAEFELNPIHLEADMSLALNVQPVEIVYDEHAVTEVVAFFQVPQMSTQDMVAMVQHSLVLLTQYSRAGLQYAIETRKHLHVSVNMRSPYMVIPEYGTLHRGGNVLIFDLGKLKIESKPQHKVENLEDLTLSEVEARLYDKYNVTITDVKALLCDSGDDWHTAQTKPDSEYHILPSVAVQLNLFNSVMPEYTQLPRFQLTTLIEKLHFNATEPQFHTLIKFYYEFPMPGNTSRLGTKLSADIRRKSEGWDKEMEVVMAAGYSSNLDFVDGAPPPALVDIDALPYSFSRTRDMRELQHEPSFDELKKMRRSVFKNSVIRKRDKGLENRVSMISTGSDTYFTASDHSDEDIEEWAKGLDISTLNDHQSESNIVTALGRFTLGEIVVQISKSEDKIDTPYLMLRVNRVCAETSLMKYGISLHASLGGIQLVDKIHKGSMGEYLEVLNSKRDAELISVSYRQVAPACPEFITVYKGIEQGAVVKLSTVQLVCDRAAVIYLNSFIQGLFHSISTNLGESRIRKSTSTILSGPVTEPYQPPEPPGFIQRLSSQVDSVGAAPYTTQFHAILEVEDIEMKLCDHDTDYADIHMTGFEGRVAVKASRTLLQAKLTDFSVVDLTENTLHPNILTIEDDNVFDLKFVKYNQEALRKPGNQPSVASTDGSLRLRIGRVQAVFLYKFVSEITAFFEPFLNPEVTEQYRLAAQQAAYTTIQDAQDQGTKISLCVNIKSPTVLVPEHSGSTNVLVLQLGDLALKNYFEDTELGGGVLQKWDHLYLSLESVQVMRGKLTMNGIMEPQHVIFEPINLKLDVKRALPPHHSDIHYQLEGHLHKVTVNLLQTDLKVLMAVLRENLTETGHLPAKIDDSDLTDPDVSRELFAPQASVDTTTTPVIEVEEPLLAAAPELSQLARQMTFQLQLDGVCVRLLTEGEVADMESGSPMKQPFSPYHGLALFEMEKLQISGTKTPDTLEVGLQLQGILMKDIRENSKNAVKYIIQSQLKAAGHYDEGLPVIDLIYKQKEDGQQHVDFSIETIRVNVCMPYLLRISHFFLDSLATPEQLHRVETVPTTTEATTMRDSLVPSRTLESMRSSGLDPRPTPRELDTDQSWIISGEFKQPELVLFADPSEQHSRVLVLKASGKFNYYLVNGTEDLDAKLKRVQIISGRYGLAKQTSSMLMHPCNLEFTRHRESPESPVAMKLKLSDVFLNVAASDIHICLGVWREIQEDRSRGVEMRDGSPAGGAKQYYDLWNTDKISREEWLKPEEPEAKPPYSAAMFEGSTPPQETVEVEASKIQVMFEVENVDYHVPRLCIQSGLKMDLYDVSTNIRAKADLHVDIHYFNDKLSLWEPFLEQVMVTEDHYRPWQVTLKMVQAPGYPISCQPPSLADLGSDELDSAVNYWLSTAARNKSSSSETESDEDSEMMVIRNKQDAEDTVLKAAGGGGSKPRHASNRSYDNTESDTEPMVPAPLDSEWVNILSNEEFDASTEADSGSRPHRSVQGESDSDGELIDTLSSGLESMISSGEGGSSDDDGLSETEDDLFDSPQKHVFLTAKGPVHLSSGEKGLDEVDGAGTAEEDKQEGPLCTYLVLDSMDQMLVNITPESLDVITEVLQTFSVEDESVIKSIQDLPGFELFNQLGEETEITLSDELRFHKERLHNVRLSTTSYREDIKAENKLVDIDEDETDGLQAVVSGLSTTGHMAIGAAGMPVDNARLATTGHPDANEKREYMSVKVKGFNELTNVSHKRDISQLIPLYPPQDNVNYVLWYHVEATHGRKVVTLRSPLQVVNELDQAVELYCLTHSLHRQTPPESPADTSYTLLKTLGAGETYDVPLKVAYHCKLFIAPADKTCEASSQGIWWQELCIAKDKRKLFTCLPHKPEQTPPCHFKVVCEEGAARLKGSPGSLSKSTPHYKLHICAPVQVHNLLPYSLHITLAEGSPVTIEQGESSPLYSSDLTTSPKLHIQVSDYLGCDWSGSLELTNDNEEFKAITMEMDGGLETEEMQNKQLSLSVRTKYTNMVDIHVYSPYWIVNKTGLPVHIRGSRSEFTYEAREESNKPLLFRFKKYKRKKAKLRVHQSKWTKSFSLDTVASHGVVICCDKERKRKYHFMLQIEMSRLSLTKIVTILPYFLVVNNYDQPLRFMEENEQADLWNDLEPGQCAPFWPVTEAKKLFVKFKDSLLCSQHFRVTHSHSTVLRMDRGSALCVDVSGGTDTSVHIVFRPYQQGDSPVRILNLCEDVFIKLYQKNQSQVSLLSPSQSVLYTWDDPTSERTLMWNVYNRKNTSHPAEIAKDKSGSVSLDIQTIRKSAVSESNTEEPGIISSLLRRSKSKEVTPSHDSSTEDDSDSEMTRISTGSLIKKTRTDKVQVYWVSYMDGMQRMLMFTQDQRIAKRAQKVNDAEAATLEIFFSLSGIGMSLINAASEEVAYLTLTSSPAMWEVHAKNKSRLLNVDLASLLEDKWRKGENQVQIEDFLQADFDKMEMKKPFLGSLKRIYNPAMWAHLRQSEHHTYVHSKIHRLQLDNQLSDAYFPTVLYPSPVPSFIVKRSGPKPFIEMILMRRQVPEKDIDTIKYASLLMQEFNIRLDKGFILSVYDIFSSRQEQLNEKEQLQQDMETVQQSLKDLTVLQVNSQGPRIFFEYVHLSPLKLRVSFSLYGNVHRAAPQDASLAADIIEFFLNSVGATFTEIKEVELRMAYFQREGVMLTLPQLQAEVQSHYVSQFVKQAYVLLLGLDVLGNPYGLITDFTKGLGDFFYEPFMGSIQQPDKFAENLSYGVHSLLGHTVGSFAGSVSLVTGSIGRTMALLSFDESYQMRRTRYMQQQPKHLPESIYLAGKSFVMGVAMGVSGVVVSPVRGVKEEGVEGFFKGMGKGLLGLLTKPTGGAVDMVSMAFDGIRRTAEMGQDVVLRIRPPRFVHPVQGLNAYSYYQAVGLRITQTVAKGEYAETDVYWAHAPLSMEERADVLLITDKRLLYLEKCKFWGDWDVEWDVQLTQLMGVPGLEGDKLMVQIKKDEESFSFFSSDTYEVESKDKGLLKWLQKKIEQVIIFVNQQQ